MACVLAVDACMRSLAAAAFADARRPGGAPCALFLDFSAAFPSVAHTFLFKCLGDAGAPEWLVTFWEAIYHDLAEELPAEEAMEAVRCKFEAGVAQGDPGSGSLFLIVIEGLLRKSRRPTG